MAATAPALVTPSGKEPPILEETYGNTSIKNRFLVVGETIRKSTQQNVGPPLQKFLKVLLEVQLVCMMLEMSVCINTVHVSTVYVVWRATVFHTKRVKIFWVTFCFISQE